MSDHGWRDCAASARVRRRSFPEQGLAERALLMVTSDAAFSMVFDGWPNGRAIVVQGMDLGQTTNVNIRFEDI